MSDDMQPGEIARSLKRLEDSQAAQTETLGEIKEQTTRTNGRVTTLEREVRDLKRGQRIEQHDAKRVTDRPGVITLTIPVNAKTIGAIVAFIVALALGGFKAGLF